MKSLILYKDNQAQNKEPIYNEVLQMCARLAKNDSTVMNKLRELKFKYSEGSISSPA